MAPKSHNDRTRLSHLVAPLIFALALLGFALPINQAVAQQDESNGSNNDNNNAEDEAVADDAEDQADTDEGDPVELDDPDETVDEEGDVESLDEADELRRQRIQEQRERRAAQLAELEEQRIEQQPRLRERRSAGWTLMHASPRTRVGAWLTHGNDDIARFFHDMHAFLQIGFEIRDWNFAIYSMWGARFQATSVRTGIDALWVGAKVLFPALSPRAGLLGAGITVGMPTNSRVDGNPVVFADHANTLIIVDTLTLDFGLFNTIYFSDVAGINLHANLQFPLGMPEIAVVNAGLELYWRRGLPEWAGQEWNEWSSDLRGGVQFSTAFTPLVIYVEPGTIHRESIRFAFRLAVTIGVGKNLGNVSDLQMLGVFEWRLG